MMLKTKMLLQNDEITQLKRQIGIYDLALAEGLKLTRVSPGTYRSLCVFHTEKTPSLTFFTKTNTYKCFGCGRGGDVVNWVKDRRGLTTGEAIGILRAMSPTFPFKATTATYKNGGHMKNGNENHGGPPPNSESAAPGASTPDTAESNSVAAIRLDPEHQKALRLYIEYCHRDLKAQQVPIDYLVQKRQITQGEIIDAHLVGWVSGTAAAKLSGEKEIARALLKLGVLKYDGEKLVERFQGCLIFPSINASGVITDITARRVTGQGKTHDLLPGGHVGFFNSRVVGVVPEIIVVESPIDALSVMALGYRNVISAFGANGFTDTMREALISSGTEKLYVAFDADGAGNRGAEKIVEKLRGSAVQIYRVELPEGQDPNDFIRKESTAQALFKDILLNSSLLYSFSVEREKESAKAENFKYSKTPDGDEFDFTSRKYLARGLEDNKNAAALKVFLRVMKDAHFHHDNFDLYTAKSVDFFTRKASDKLRIDERILRADLDMLTLRLEALRKALVLQDEKGAEEGGATFHRNLRMDKLAREWVADPLIDLRFIEACEKSGVVGEGLVASVCWEATFTRFFETPLHILIQSESSSGKSTIQRLTKDFMPAELVHFFTELSENTLYYQAADAFWQVVIFIAEAEGIEKARFAVKQMMSDGILSKGSVQQDQKTGEFASIRKESRIRAPFIITLPKELEDDEFINRCLCLTLDESAEQTARIQEMQRRMYGPEGVKIRAARKYYTELFQHVQRLLEVLPVSNPYAEHFRIGAKGSLGRRDLPKILSLCEAITFEHQAQRERVTIDGVVHIRTHLIDVALLYFKVKRIFPSTLDDLPPQGRKFFQSVLGYMREIAERDNIDLMAVEVYRKHTAERTGKAPQRVAELMALLERYEYFLSTRDRQGLRYRLQFRPDDEGNVSSKLSLPPLSEIKRRAPKKERDEYEAFLPHLKQIFKALDPKWSEADGEF